MRSATVDTIYIPYVDTATHVLDMFEADIEGNLSASVIEARLDPGSWFGRRSVARIVRVRASRGEGPPGTEPESFDDDGPDEEVPPPIRLPPKAQFEAKARSQLFTGPVLAVHRRMLKVFSPIQQRLVGGLLGASQIIDLLNARTHPGYRDES